jgi:hypothetical protein
MEDESRELGDHGNRGTIVRRSSDRTKTTGDGQAVLYAPYTRERGVYSRNQQMKPPRLYAGYPWPPVGKGDYNAADSVSLEVTQRLPRVEVDEASLTPVTDGSAMDASHH